jgi:hypothetical protein
MGFFSRLFGPSRISPQYAARRLNESMNMLDTIAAMKIFEKTASSETSCPCGRTFLVKEAFNRDPYRLWLSCPACKQMLAVIGKLDKPDFR